MHPTYGDCYEATWNEQQNVPTRMMLHGKLRKGGEPVIAVVQPGDGTKYRFLLVPTPTQHIVSNDGRATARITSERPSLLVTVLDGLGTGIAEIGREYSEAGIRQVLAEDIRFRNNNSCTVEALVQTIMAIWSPGDTA